MASTTPTMPCNCALAGPMHDITHRRQTPLDARLWPYASPSMSPTSRRTPERCCACARASASKPILSSRPGSPPPTARFAAPVWTISMPSSSCGMPSWREFDGLAAAAASSPGPVHDRSQPVLLRLPLCGRRHFAVRPRNRGRAARRPRRRRRPAGHPDAAGLALAQRRGCRRHGRRRSATADWGNANSVTLRCERFAAASG